MRLKLKIKSEKKLVIMKEQHMGKNRFLKYGLIISCILFFVSCKNENTRFYENIRNNNCMIACTFKSGNKSPIDIVTEKSYMFYVFKKYNCKIDDSIIINSIRKKISIEVPLNLYQYLCSWQTISQQRVDSLLKIDIDKFFVKTLRNDRYICPDDFNHLTYMEELYIIKVLFDNKILVQQDCESGYYFEIR